MNRIFERLGFSITHEPLGESTAKLDLGDQHRDDFDSGTRDQLRELARRAAKNRRP
jgi:hypothetical protein